MSLILTSETVTVNSPSNYTTNTRPLIENILNKQETIATYTWGANFQIVGKTDPHKLSGPFAWENQTGTLADLADHLSKGHPFMPSLLTGNRRRWQQNANYASLLAIDVDEGMTIDEAIDHPFIRQYCGLAIETTSSRPGHHKFRLIFPLMEAIEGWRNIKTATLYLQHLVGAADKACSDSSRFYFGSLGRSPFILKDVTLPENFLEQSLEWQAEIDRAKAEEKAERERVRRETQERIKASGNVDLVQLIEHANDRLGFDAFLPHLEHQKEQHGKYRCKPVFRSGSGSYSAFVSEKDGKTLYHDPTAQHGCDGFRFFVWLRHGEGYKPTGKDFVELAREYCSIAGIDVPEYAKPKGFSGKSKAVSNAIVPFKFDEAESVRRNILNPFGKRPALEIHGGADLADYLLENPYQNILISAPTGAGKTNALIPLARAEKCTAISPSRSLKANLEARLGCDAIVINSLFKLPDGSIGDHFIGDEIDQILHALTLGEHLQNREANKRAFQRFTSSRRTIAQSATANIDDLELLENITGKTFQLINFTPDHGYFKPSIELHHGDPEIKGSATASKAAVIERIRGELINGNRVLFAFDEKVPDLIVRALHWGLKDENILLINAASKQEDPRAQSFVESPDPGIWLKNHPEILLVAYNSAVPAGFSIQDPEGEELFSLVAGIFTGRTVAPALVNQMIYRYRGNAPIIISVPFKAHFRCATGTNHRNAQGYGKAKKLNAKRLNRLDRERAIGLSTGRGFNFSDDEFSLYQEKLELRLDREYRNFVTATIAYLEKDGFSVAVVPHKDKGELENFREEIQQIKAKPILEARAISESEYQSLKHTPELSALALAQIDAYEIRKFYGLNSEDDLSLELIMAEGSGKGRKQFQNLLRLTIEGKALADDLARADLLGPDCSSFDMSNHAATLRIWDSLRIPEILAHALERGYSMNDEFLREWWDSTIHPYIHASHGSPGIFGFKIPSFTQGDYAQLPWLIGMILRKIGLRTESQRHRTGEGEERLRVYRVTDESLNEARERILRSIEIEGFQVRDTPLARIFCEGMARTAPASTMGQYLAALEREDIPEIERLALILDSEEGARV